MKDKKNYIILGGLLILVICACLAFYNIYNKVQQSLISSSPLVNNNTVDFNDLDNVLNELNADTFLFISYTNDENIYNNEKSIKKLLNKKNLLDNVLYLDVTNLIDDTSYLDEINTKLNLNDKIEVLPAVLYIRNGNIEYSIDSSDHLLDSGDISKIIDMYELDK